MNVDIPGIGVVAFPDSMSQDAVNAQAQRLFAGANQSPQTGNFQSPAGYSGAPDEPLQPQYPIETGMALFGTPGPGRLATPGFVQQGIGMARALPQALPAIGRVLGASLGSASKRISTAGPATAIEMAMGHHPTIGPAMFGLSAAKGAGQQIAKEAAPAVGRAVGMEALHGGGSASSRVVQQISRDAEILAKHDATEAATAEASKAGKHLASLRWSKTSGSAASRVATRSAEPAAKAAGAAETRAASKAIPENGPTPGEKFNPPEELGPRHNVQRWSKSAKQMKTIENMPQPHLRAALAQDTKRLAALGKNAEKRAPVLHAVIEAMKKEIAHRAATTGVHGY